MSGLSADAGFPVPSGYHPPFAVVTENDHTAWILVVTALGMAWVFLFSGIRAFVRSTICPGTGLDDAFLAGATVLAIFQSSMILSASSDGLGKSVELISSNKHAKVQQLYYAGSLLFITALGLSKLSVISLLLRLTPFNIHRRVFYAVAAFTTAWTVGSLFAAALQCNLAHPWVIVGEQCSGALLRWQIICTVDIIIEVSLVGMSVLLVFNLQTSLWTKVAVVTTFAPRLLMIIPISLRLSNFKEAARTSNFTLLDDLFIVWTQTELDYSLISATIPTMRSLVSNLNTQFGGLGEVESAHGYSYNKGSSKDNSKLNDSFQMSKLRSIASQEDTKKRTRATIGVNPSERQEIYRHNIRTSSVTPGESISEVNGIRGSSGQTVITGDARSVSSNDSQLLMIRKEITYKVEHHVEG